MQSRSWHLWSWCRSRSRGSTSWEVVTCIAYSRVLIADPGANTLAKKYKCRYNYICEIGFSLVLTYSILLAQPANPSTPATQAMYAGGSSRSGKHAMDMDNHRWAGHFCTLNTWSSTSKECGTSPAANSLFLLSRRHHHTIINELWVHIYIARMHINDSVSFEILIW